ncbi:50S ribosomal protein L35 [Herbivorax sp. ANBcel31]|uniref:50S ribosomal protein L35 n=1 Tax=Herbivorax sp. ANBcel31 TaxID=3069754 RepID=UPI0027B50794|nr:50S ribosomal protein L35 [Herbivorax sp. ANBcel31]MDQ2087328.1 50S ribosomal protein L35 [Herbivorax sp. ANBcel31]
MPKIKTHSSSKKRFKLTGTGKVKRAQAYRNHILTKKSTKRKRKLRNSTVASDANSAIIRKMIPYK